MFHCLLLGNKEGQTDAVDTPSWGNGTPLTSPLYYCHDNRIFMAITLFSIDEMDGAEGVPILHDSRPPLTTARGIMTLHAAAAAAASIYTCTRVLPGMHGGHGPMKWDGTF